VNAVVPGAVETPAFLEYIGTEERLAKYASQIPMGRMARPEDIANAVAWLASDDAAYVTGIALPVDGGGTAALHQPVVD
jgi:NAD(P)-dependent dehydrogenase (short-subunit alcohol dehydrogenase family)